MKEILIFFFLLYNFDLSNETDPDKFMENIKYIPDLIKGLEEADHSCYNIIKNIVENKNITDDLVKVLDKNISIFEFLLKYSENITLVIDNCYVYELIKTLSHYALEKDGIYDLGVNMEKNALIISKSSKLFMSREKDWTKKFVNLGKVIKYVFNITYFK